MSTTTRATEPLRSEHQDLWPHLAALGTLAAELDRWSDATAGRLAELVAFLRGHLVPHALAEEAVLYPKVEGVLGAPRATATMVADHVEIVRRIDELERIVEEVGTARPEPAALERLRGRLYGLDAILALHFAKEEEVLLPVLDEHLAAEEAEAMFRAMGQVAHGH